ncbi:hypothetical protein HYC85_019620 [Camellia sinensis]|uniref:Glutaredoxin domain-containing protein n=1 Tax=Camellia sinensis TaxID=4442 RepID=A0A7J7GRE6_CAMSI|nr:hypothetical protein HYC85_019620 [Camellia sinensis]
MRKRFLIYETPKPNTPYAKTKAKAMWRRLSTQLHLLCRRRQHLFSPAVAFPAIHYILFLLPHFQLRYKEILKSANGPLKLSWKGSQQGLREVAAGSFNHHGMQYSTTMLNDPDIHEDFKPTNKLKSSGLSLKDVKDNPVMLYMKGVPDLPRCGFSSLAVRVLKEYSYYGILTIDMPFADVPLSARNLLEDPELKNAITAYRLDEIVSERILSEKIVNVGIVSEKIKTARAEKAAHVRAVRDSCSKT